MASTNLPRAASGSFAVEAPAGLKGPSMGQVLRLAHSRWTALTFAFLATVINYLDRQTLSVLAPLLLDKFEISATTYGQIISLFMLSYTIANGVSGGLLDKFGTRIGYAFCVAFWSAAELLHVFLGGAISLGIFRFLLGAGEAGNYPAGVKLISEWFPARERSIASGIFNSGAAVGSILAPPLFAWITIRMGWRATFVVVGTTGFIWLGAWLFIYRLSCNDNSPQIVSEPTQRNLRGLIGQRFVWQFAISKMLSDPAWYFYTFWFPQYLKVAHGFSLAEIGRKAFIPFVTAGLGNLAGGIVCQQLIGLGCTAQTARRTSVIFFALLMASGAATGYIHSATAAIALVSVATFGYCGALANLLAIPGDIYPHGAVASVWGLASMGAGFGSMIFSALTGVLIDHYSFKPVFILFGTIPILGAVVVWFLPRGLITSSTDSLQASSAALVIGS
jgi:MFS transporter, ACS family, hexuronate transporter